MSCARVKHDEIGLAVLWEGIIGDRGVLITFGGEKRSPSPANSLAAPSGGHPFSRMQRSRISFVDRTKEMARNSREENSARALIPIYQKEAPGCYTGAGVSQSLPEESNRFRF